MDEQRHDQRREALKAILRGRVPAPEAVRRAPLHGFLCLVALFAALIAQPVSPQELTLPADFEGRANVTHQFQMLEDPKGTLKPLDILTRSDGLMERWRKVGQSTLPIGMSRSVFWLRLRVRSLAASSSSYYLIIPSAQVDGVQLHAWSQSTHLHTRLGGDRHPGADRVVASPYTAFELPLRTGATTTLVLRVSGSSFLNTPVHLADETAFRLARDRTRQVVYMLAGAGLLAMLYAAFQFVRFREQSYLTLLIYTLGLATALWIGYGQGDRLFGSVFPESFDKSYVVWFAVAAIATSFLMRQVCIDGCLFMVRRWAFDAVALLPVLAAGVFLLGATGPHALCALVLFCAITALGTVAWILLRVPIPVRPRRIFAASWGIVALLVLVGLGRRWFGLPYHPLTAHSFVILLPVHMLLLWRGIAETRIISLAELTTQVDIRAPGSTVSEPGIGMGTVTAAQATSEAPTGAQEPAQSEALPTESTWAESRSFSGNGDRTGKIGGRDSARNNSSNTRKKREKTNDHHVIQMLDARALEREITDLMREEKLYLDQELTLRDLADRLEVSRHQLSIFLNRYLGKSFYRLLDTYRIPEAQKLLAERPELSILQIGFKVGYSSKATFNRKFRAVTGKSPRAYRQHYAN